MSLQSLKRKDLLQTLDPDLTLDAPHPNCVMCIRAQAESFALSLVFGWLALAEKHHCITLNFWRPCERNKANIACVQKQTLQSESFEAGYFSGRVIFKSFLCGYRMKFRG